MLHVQTSCKEIINSFHIYKYSHFAVANMAQGQVQVHFSTTSPDIELPEGKQQLLVPTSKF